MYADEKHVYSINIEIDEMLISIRDKHFVFFYLKNRLPKCRGPPPINSIKNELIGGI